MSDDGFSILPKVGERSLFVGRTGSGKTAGAIYFACNLDPAEYGPLIVYDTKIDPKFDGIPNSTVITDPRQIPRLREHLPDLSTFIVRPELDVSIDPSALDNLLLYHYHALHFSIAFLDELYTFHNGAKAGPGLTGLLTRGRSKGITTLQCTQRPAWISRFCLTESENFYLYRLTDSRDLKTLASVIPDVENLPPPELHWFYYYSIRGNVSPQLFRPIPIDKLSQVGYTDKATDTSSIRRANRLLWL